jgi:uroporphyrinogen decarboxylase
MSMTRRERVRAALRFEETDQLPKDLSAMASTGVSCFAYPKLVAALGLPPRLPKIFDTGQMLAIPDTDVLDALDCDCCFVGDTAHTNAFEEPERWHRFDFGGRLPALVQHPENYEVLPDGTIMQGNRAMVPNSYVFDAPHGGQPPNLLAEPQREDLDALAKRLEQQTIPAERIEALAAYCRRARESTGRAIMFRGPGAGLGFRGGMAAFSMMCLLDPGYVRELHDIVTDHAVRQLEQVLPAIAPYVDIIMLAADDQGTQQASILPPDTFAELFAPFYRKVNDACHRAAPEVFTFLHSCGAIYNLLDAIIDAGFDILNPVQWNAGGHSFQEWKDTCRRRIALWGGGVDTQTTLPLGSLAAVQQQVRDVVGYLSQDSGFVFCAIHNLLAEIPAEKIVAIYRTAAKA